MRIGMLLANEFVADPRVFNEAKILINAGFEVFVLCYNHDNLPNRETRDGINIVRFDVSKKVANRRFGLINRTSGFFNMWRDQISRFISEFKPDAIHVHDLYMIKAAHLANRESRLPIVLDLHENFPAAIKSYTWATKFPKSLLVKPGKWEKLEKPFLKMADKIIVLSENFKEELLAKYPFLDPESMFTYPNVPDLEEFSNYKIEENILETSDSFVLFYFGGIAVRRGIFTLFEALKLLKKDIPEIKLLLIGPVDKADKERFTMNLSDPEIKDHVIYYEWKDISYLPSYIKASDVCLSPIVKNAQHDSGVANKVFQYMLFECPLVVSDCTPQKRIVEEERCGLAFRSEDAGDLADKIMQLYRSPDERKKMGNFGRKAIMEKYNTREAGKRLVELYRSLL